MVGHFHCTENKHGLWQCYFSQPKCPMYTQKLHLRKHAYWKSTNNLSYIIIAHKIIIVKPFFNQTYHFFIRLNINVVNSEKLKESESEARMMSPLQSRNDQMEER